MAVSDIWIQLFGTAVETRIPASGVAERVTFIVKPQGVDGIVLTDLSTDLIILAATAENDLGSVAAFTLTPAGLFIDNANSLEKIGTTDSVYMGGVQVNA